MIVILIMIKSLFIDDNILMEIKVLAFKGLDTPKKPPRFFLHAFL